MERQIRQWVPDGTPLTTARQIMEQHGFTCSVVSFDRAEQMTNKLDAAFWKMKMMENGQQVQVTNVSHLDCEKPRIGITFILLNGKTIGFLGGGQF
jgi:hypothetical protein